MQTTCTFANATGARLEFFEDGSNGLLSDDYKPPLILEPGAVASFLVDKDTFALQYNIQVFQGPGAPAPVGGWMSVEDSKAVTLGLGLNPTTNRRAEIDAEVQVMDGVAALEYPTKFIFGVYETGNLVQIFAKQLINSEGSSASPVAASTTLPVFDAATPKVSILAIGKNTLDSANELLVAAEKQAAEFQPQATLKADFMLKNYAAGPGSTAGAPPAVSSCPRAQRVPACTRRCIQHLIHSRLTVCRPSAPSRTPRARVSSSSVRALEVSCPTTTSRP